MPIIRGERTGATLSTERRNALHQRLEAEFAGDSSTGGPVIFEIPIDGTDRLDILVVWPEFDGLRSEERTQLILGAYPGDRGRIAQALGVTYAEVLEQNLLPYAVVPMARRGEADDAKLRAAMLEEGGLILPGDRIDLRFPTMTMAQSAHRRLCEKMPNGYWSMSIPPWGSSSTTTTTTTTMPPSSV